MFTDSVEGPSLSVLIRQNKGQPSCVSRRQTNPKRVCCGTSKPLNRSTNQMANMTHYHNLYRWKGFKNISNFKPLHSGCVGFFWQFICMSIIFFKMLTGHENFHKERKCHDTKKATLSFFSLRSIFLSFHTMNNINNG